MIIPFVVGVVSTCLFVAYLTQTKPGPTPSETDPDCEVAILLWEVIKGDIESELANLGGGRTGISHASIDLCEVDEEGWPLMVECYPREGVTRSRRDRYGSRRHATIVLYGEDAAEVRRCVKAKIGRPFDPLGMFSGIIDPEALVCSTLVYSCLPMHLRELVDQARPDGAIGAAVSPAQLALAFGADIDGDPVLVK